MLSRQAGANVAKGETAHGRPHRTGNGTADGAPLGASRETDMKHVLRTTGAPVTGALMVGVALAAAAFANLASAGEAPGGVFSGPFEVNGKIRDSFAAGKGGDGFALAYEEVVTAPGAAGHDTRCFGVMQGVRDRIVEQHGYCLETDPGGDQVLWKITPGAHPMGSAAVVATHEAVAGTGRHAGVSETITTTCAVAAAGPTDYALKCEAKR